MAVIKITSENFEEIISSNKLVLVDFWANWCGPCKMISPIIEAISAEREDVIVGKIDVDEQPELAKKFGVMSIPTFVVLKNGKVANQSSGARPKSDILALLD